MLLFSLFNKDEKGAVLLICNCETNAIAQEIRAEYINEGWNREDLFVLINDTEEVTHAFL